LGCAYGTKFPLSVLFLPSAYAYGMFSLRNIRNIGEFGYKELLTFVSGNDLIKHIQFV
jgi:hypothetical protein